MLEKDPLDRFLTFNCVYVCLKIPGGNGIVPKLNTDKHVMLFLLRKSDNLLSFRKNFTEEGFCILQKIVHGLKFIYIIRLRYEKCYCFCSQ